MRRCQLITVALSIALAALSARADTPASAPTAADQKPIDQSGPVITDDLLKITITDLVGPGIDTDKLTRVDAKGQIALPLIGRQVVKDLTVPQIEDKICQAYRKANLIMNAQVKAVRIESGSDPSIKSAPIAPGDTIEIEIDGLEGPGIVTRRRLTVEAPSGAIQLPELKKPVVIKTLTEPDAERAVAKAYKDTKLLPNADVSIRRVTAKPADAKK